MSASDRRLVKLVRDDVERFSGGDLVVRYQLMGDAEFERALHEKLVEEALEYALDPTVEELGDVYGVLVTLARLRHGGLTPVLQAARRKRDHKGGFGARLGMYLHVAEEHRD